MSKEKPKRKRSTKSKKAELEAKIAELEAKLSDLSSQVQPGTEKPAETRDTTPSKPSRGTLPAGFKQAPKPEPKPQPKTEQKPAPRPAASGPTHGTLPAGFKPAPKPEPKPEPRPESASVESAPEAVGEISPAYATLSSSGYSGNRYYATRRRLAYHPPNKQFRGEAEGESATVSAPPSPPAPEPAPEPRRAEPKGTLPAGTKNPEKKSSLWRSKGAEYENYTPEETKREQPRPEPTPSKPSRGTLPAGFKQAPKPEPKPQPKTEQKPAPRPAASGPTHGTLPAGFKPAPKPEPKPEPRPESASVESAPEAVGEISPAYATLSSSGYSGNRYYATRRRLAYHPPNKQFRGGSESTTREEPQVAEPPKPKPRRGTLPAGFKP